MGSFQKLWENIQLDKTKTPRDDKAMSVVRTGIGISEDFWANFLLVINNSEGLSELLDIPIHKIANWHDKIEHCLKKVKDADATPSPKDNSKLLKTGMEPESDPNAVVSNLDK